ncbi:MAG TPA: hypothetical protein VFQ84_06230 [Arenimonas sp.]|uniref:hypothetical protein n=1 Tax=Arenimonas sp. TaxID=1872635 RepID=UPI002D7F6ED5|nr:hypothetical protein [Arenimonas sp.]HEU0152924.1 hypothetical protein [Arenimonas sp.]
MIKQCRPAVRFAFWTAAILNIFLLGLGSVLVVALVILPDADKWVSRGVPFGVGLVLGMVFSSLLAKVSFKYILGMAKRVEELER